jgi:hypothetical protein
LVLAIVQPPLPEQRAAAVNVEPLQAAGAQVRLLGACVQAPSPLQVPVLPQVPLAAHWPDGAVALAGSAAQAPRLPVTLQAWQVPQAVLDEQQTPSMQLPLPHSCPVPQVPPSPFLVAQDPLAVAVQ